MGAQRVRHVSSDDSSPIMHVHGYKPNGEGVTVHLYRYCTTVPARNRPLVDIGWVTVDQVQICRSCIAQKSRRDRSKGAKQA